MAIGNLGKLSVFLDVNMAGFVAGMTTASAQVKGLAATIVRNSAVFASLGKSIVLYGAAMTAGIVLITKAAGDLEHAMLGVRKTTGYAGAELEALRNSFEKLSTKIPISADELATIGEVAGQLGIRGVKNIANFTEVAAKMSIATKLSAEESALALAKLSNAFDDPIEKVVNLGSVINMLSNTTAANSIEITDAMRRMAPAAAQLGIASWQVAAITATIVEVGMTARRVGSRMRRAFTSMATDYAKMASEVGISGAEFKKQILADPVKALEMYLEAAAKMPDALSRLAIAEEIFGSAGAQAINQLSAQLPRLRENLENSAEAYKLATSLEEEFKNMMTGTWNQLKILRNELMLHVRDLGRDLLPVIKDDIIPALKAWLKNLGDFILRNREVIKGIILFTAKLGPMTVALGALLILLPKVASATTAVSVALAYLAKNPAFLAIIGTMYAYKNFLDLQNAIVGAIKEQSNEREVEKMRLDNVSKSYEKYNELLESARDGIIKMVADGTKVPASLRMAVNELDKTIQRYKEGKATVEELTIAIKLYKEAQKGMLYKVGKEEVDGIKKVISLREEEHESYRKIEDLKNQISLMSLEGIEKEIAKENYRHISRLEQIEKEYEKKKEVAILLTALEQELHDLLIKDIEDQKDMTIQMLKTLESSFQSTFAGALKGQITSFRDFFDSIVNSMRSRWADLVAEMVTNWIKGQFAMQEATGGGSNIGSWLSIIGGLVGLGGVAAGASSGALLNSTPSDLGGLGYTGIPAGYADGGMVPATGMYKLHEGEEVRTREPGGSSPVTIVNVLSPDLITAAMASTKGQKVIVNTISTDILKNGITRKTMKGGL